MELIDTHVHFWDLSNKMNSWVLRTSNPNLQKNYLPDNLMNVCDKELLGVVHVEAHDSAIPTIKEVEWLKSEMQKYDLQYRHIAFADVTLPLSEFKKIIDELKGFKNIVGIRHTPFAHNPKFAYNPTNSDLSANKNIAKNLEYLAQNNLIFNCQVYASQIKNILPAIINADVITIIDHMLLPAWNKEGDEDCKLWQDTIIQVAQHKNIYMKLSGLDMFQQDYDFAVKFCLENFSFESLVYGSNYPVSCNDNYNAWVNYLVGLDYAEKTKEQIFYKNAKELFKFN